MHPKFAKLVQGFWQNAWWTSTVKDIEEDGTVVCLSDATPVYPEGEEWEVERENLRAGHPQEALAFGMLNLANAPAALPQSAWRFDPRPTIFTGTLLSILIEEHFSW